jgi:Zn-finger protein
LIESNKLVKPARYFYYLTGLDIQACVHCFSPLYNVANTRSGDVRIHRGGIHTFTCCVLQEIITNTTDVQLPARNYSRAWYVSKKQITAVSKKVCDAGCRKNVQLISFTHCVNLQTILKGKISPMKEKSLCNVSAGINYAVQLYVRLEMYEDSKNRRTFPHVVHVYDKNE